MTMTVGISKQDIKVVISTFRMLKKLEATPNVSREDGEDVNQTRA